MSVTFCLELAWLRRFVAGCAASNAQVEGSSVHVMKPAPKALWKKSWCVQTSKLRKGGSFWVAKLDHTTAKEPCHKRLQSWAE
jgi:hypothetical protein